MFTYSYISNGETGVHLQTVISAMKKQVFTYKQLHQQWRNRCSPTNTYISNGETGVHLQTHQQWRNRCSPTVTSAMEKQVFTYKHLHQQWRNRCSPTNSYISNGEIGVHLQTVTSAMEKQVFNYKNLLSFSTNALTTRMLCVWFGNCITHQLTFKNSCPY